MWVTIVKFVGKETAKQVLKEFTGPGFELLKNLLLGEDENTIDKYLESLDRQMREVALSLKEIELRQIFLDYNRADEDLEFLFDLYGGQADKPLDHRDRQNTCNYILDINRGVSERARRMIGAFRHVNLPSYKTFFQEYSDKLSGECPDIYSYLGKMDAVVNHLRKNLMEAKLLREMAYADIADKERVTDLALTEADSRRVEQHYDEVVKPVTELKNLFEGLAEWGGNIRLKHDSSGKYLTAYEEGSPLSKDKPFERRSKTLMPQLYLYELGRGQEEKYGEIEQASWDVITVKVDGASQDWKVIKLGHAGGPIGYAFKRGVSKKALDGVHGGRVYLNDLPGDGENPHMWWRPVIAKDGEGRFERGVFMLKHVRSGNALDSDGQRVYADNRQPDHANVHMKWRFDQRNSLEPGEFLAPGEELVSLNQRYALRYLKNGNLEFVDRRDERVLWESGTGGRGAWRCVMQKDDGQFVLYAKEREPVWSTIRRGSRLVMRQGGFFEVVDRHDNPVYDTKWTLRRKHINTLEPDEFLAPGERLLSQDQRYELRYLENGNLELFDAAENKVWWDSGTKGKGAWRCVMQRRNGRFVVYTKEQQVVWATEVENAKFADSKLVLLNDGTLQLATPGNSIYWKKPKVGEVSWRS